MNRTAIRTILIICAGAISLGSLSGCDKPAAAPEPAAPRDTDTAARQSLTASGSSAGEQRLETVPDAPGGVSSSQPSAARAETGPAPLAEESTGTAREPAASYEQAPARTRPRAVLIPSVRPAEPQPAKRVEAAAGGRSDPRALRRAGRIATQHTAGSYEDDTRRKER